jgi:hypothetical protein
LLLQQSIIIDMIRVHKFYFRKVFIFGNKGKFLVKQLFGDLPSVPPGVELTGHAHAEAVVLPTRDPVKNK